MISGKERGLDPQFPWRKGFIPPKVRCAQCGGGVCQYTGQRDQYGNHTYRCLICNADFAAMTQYAYCDYHERLVEKDLFYTPCQSDDTNCPHFTSVGPQNLLRCSHFKPVQRDGMDYKEVKAVEESMRIFGKPKHELPTELPASGLESGKLERMRKERLRRLQEEG